MKRILPLCLIIAAIAGTVALMPPTSVQSSRPMSTVAPLGPPEGKLIAEEFAEWLSDFMAQVKQSPRGPWGFDATRHTKQQLLIVNRRMLDEFPDFRSSIRLEDNGVLWCGWREPAQPKRLRDEQFIAFPPEDVRPAKHARGYKLPTKEVSAARHRISNAKYGNYLRSLPKATQVAYDATAAQGGSCVPPTGDQNGCGDCYFWSGVKSASAAQMVAKVVPPGSGFMGSVQWGLDHHPEQGGCDGGQEFDVANVILKEGMPSDKQYPGAGVSPGRPIPTTGMTLYTIVSVIYVDPAQTDQGVADTQAIKNAILAHSYVSVAAAAGGDWDNLGPNGTITGRSRDVNHAIGASGWDDNHDNGDGTKGAFIGENQWGKSWGQTINGIQGRFWIKYGADSFGTGAFVCIAAPPVPPTPPTPPTPPDPIPPTPPTPPVPPSPTPGVTTITTSAALAAGTYEVVAFGTMDLALKAKAANDALYNRLMPEPVTPPSPCGKEQDALRERARKLEDAFLKIGSDVQEIKRQLGVKP